MGARVPSTGLPAATARVAVDALGGDHGAAVVIDGALRASRRPGVFVSLVGPEPELRRELARAGGLPAALDVVDAPEAVGMGEKLSLATLKKRSSIQVGLERVRDGQADAFFWPATRRPAGRSRAAYSGRFTRWTGRRSPPWCPARAAARW